MIRYFLIVLVPLVLSASSIESSVEFLEGKKIYEETCASCHGVNGETNPAMLLTVKPRRLKESILTQNQMVKMISEGGHRWGAHSDIMPAFKYVYETKQIENVALYVSKAFNFNREERIKKILAEADMSELDESYMLKKGKKIFMRNCSLCHGLTGNGESVYVEQSKANKEFLFPYNLRKIFLTEEQIFLYAREGGHFWGTDKEDMPSWKKKYNDKILRSVAHYIKTKIVEK